jgi:hypothetical protein
MRHQTLRELLAGLFCEALLTQASLKKLPVNGSFTWSGMMAVYTFLVSFADTMGKFSGPLRTSSTVMTMAFIQDLDTPYVLVALNDILRDGQDDPTTRGRRRDDCTIGATSKRCHDVTG